MKRISIAICLISVLFVGCGQAEAEPEKEPEAIEEKEEEEEAAEIKSVEVTYAGNTEAGTVLDASNNGFTVKAKYSDGTQKTVSGWDIPEPQTLEAEKTSKVTIVWVDEETGLEWKTDLDIECTSIDEDAYKESCESIAYDDLARYPDEHEGKKIVISGQLLQVLEDDEYVELRVGTRDGYDDVVYVFYQYKEGDPKFLEDDQVTFYGKSLGTITYESVLGGEITIPAMLAEFAELN